MSVIRFLVFVACLPLLVIGGCKTESSHSRSHFLASSPPDTTHYKAMVVSAHPDASRVGEQILQKGGNAVDAAIAVQYALAVVFPVAGNIGGGGFMIFRDTQGKYAALDYREKAPAGATRDMYLDSAQNVIPNLSLNGHLAAGVPGSVAGFFAAHERFGKLPMQVLIQPAIDLAEKGFLLTQKDARMLNDNRALFQQNNTQLNAFTHTDTFVAGERFIQPELANTLKKIQLLGKSGFYEGETADLIVAEMKRGNGIMTKEDLKNYEAKWRDPIQGNYKDYTITSMSPPSSGGIALLQLFQSIESQKILQEDWHQPALTHFIVEAERRVYADRAKHLGDKDFYNVPIKGLLDKNYILTRIKDIHPLRATPSSTIMAGNPPIEKEQTTHLSIVDKDGNAVSVTTTLNGAFGCNVVVGRAGFLLNNEMDDFAIKPGVPNYYGLVGAEANAIQPHKRMLSSMTPTIVEKNGKLWMVVGTPGGSTIITSVFQTILNVMEHKMTMQNAVTAPRFHHQWLPDKIMYEKDCFSTEVLTSLQQKGHTLEERKGPSGRVDAILVKEDGFLQGGADPRGDDTAIGIR